MIVKEGSSLTIVNETTIFIKTIVLKNKLFEKTIVFKMIVSFSIFGRRFHNETIVLKKMKTLNILTDTTFFNMFVH